MDATDLTDGQLVYQVHDVLRKAVLFGELVPGQDYSQLELSRQAGVSRTPLREAIRMLEREGLLELSPNKKFRVSSYSVADMEDLYALRISIEANAIRLTVPRLTSEDAARLEGLYTQMNFFAEREDYDRYQVPHRSFHDALVAKSGKRITASLAELSDHCERYRRLCTTNAPNIWNAAMAQHRSILDACLQGDAHTAAIRLTEHLSNTVRENVMLLEPDHKPTIVEEIVNIIKTTAPQTHQPPASGRHPAPADATPADDSTDPKSRRPQPAPL